jgi:alpha-ketoglutarate-dependent 2,4-dichlorophenoxyacetate dioxygenase
VEITSATPEFGAEIRGADLSRPTDALIEQCWQLFDRYAVCVFRDSGLDDAHHVTFSRFFGDLEFAPRPRHAGAPRFAYPQLFDAGNLDREGKIVTDEKRRLFNRGNQQWHTDSSFRPARASYSMLLSHIVPPAGGETQFVDLRAAHDALPSALRARLTGLEAEHSIWHSRALAGYPPATEEERALIPSARQPLLLRHPRTGRPSLYLARHASHIIGMDEAESAKLLDELIAFATQPEFVHTHHWQVGDLLVWDNRCTMHRATPFDETRHPRDMRRTTVIDGTAPTMARQTAA